jgi:hypothetical protein
LSIASTACHTGRDCQNLGDRARLVVAWQARQTVPRRIPRPVASSFSCTHGLRVRRPSLSRAAQRSVTHGPDVNRLPPVSQPTVSAETGRTVARWAQRLRRIHRGGVPQPRPTFCFTCRNRLGGRVVELGWLAFVCCIKNFKHQQKNDYTTRWWRKPGGIVHGSPRPNRSARRTSVICS